MERTPEVAPRMKHGYALYRAVFGATFEADNIHSVADIGAGDSDFAQRLEADHPDKEVWRLDAQYALEPPKGEHFKVVDAKDMHEIPDGRYDLTVSAFMLQHIDHDNGDAARAIKEMIRITKTGDDLTSGRGAIMIFPVWRPGKLRQALAENGFDESRVWIGFPDRESLHENDPHIDDKETLLIRKTTDMTDEEAARLAAVIEKSKGLDRRESGVTLSAYVMKKLMNRKVKKKTAA